METERTTDPAAAAAYIRRGGLVAFPTETVYGLGADAFDERAVRAIFAAKGRPPDNPLIVHVGSLRQIEDVAASIPAPARILIDRFFPGPLTVILPRHPGVPAVVSAGLDTIGIRMPGLDLTRAFLQACDTPVAAPSANRSGGPSPTTWEATAADLDGRIDCILQGPPAVTGLESTVIDCTAEPPLVLRPGIVTLEQLQAVLPATRFGATPGFRHRRSPGTRYRHYAPVGKVVLVPHPDDAVPGPEAAYLGLTPPDPQAPFAFVESAPDLESYARRLYAFFRRCDDAGVARIYCQTVPPAGLGSALMDRLTRAAENGPSHEA